MRRATVATFSAIGTALAAALACGVITIPPEPTAPTNTCTGDPSCATLFPDASTAPTCAAGFCSVQGFGTTSPFLVVAIPTDVAGFGGMTVPLPPNYAALRTKTGVPNQCSTPDGVECDFIAPLTSFGGGVLQVVAGEFDQTIWPPKGFLPNLKTKVGQTVAAALPVTVTLEMLWKDPATDTYMLARKLGIALDDVVGTTSTNSALLAPTTSSKPQPGFNFSAMVPQPFSPEDPMSAYTMNVVPVDPYGVVPPFVFGRNNPLTTPVTQTGLVSLSVSLFGATPLYDTPTPDGGSPIVQHDYEVDEDPGAPSLAGWTMHIDDVDGHRVSGNVTLGAGSPKAVHVYEATGTPSQTSETLFIDPPPGVDLPRYKSPAVLSQIFGPFAYPALPPPVTIEGSVITSDFQATGTARIVFAANPFASNNVDYILEADGTTQATSLIYSKIVTTDSKGQYSVTLPPGNFRVYVVPDDDSLALTWTDKLVSPSDAGVQAGKALTVRRRSHVKGRVVLENGEPVFAADVVISASADSGLPAFNDDPLARPRESRGTTDVGGNFDVPADSGLVDISIRPRDGTNFPWVVLMNRTVPLSDGADASGQLTLSLPDVVVPAPSRYTQKPMGELTDNVGNPISHAVVRAYAFPQPTPGPDGGAPVTRGARLVGMTFTDENAFFQLFLAPPE